jgi:arylsulfatase A-like enzyme
MAPQKYKDLFKEDELILHPNVPEKSEKKARRDLAGYYAHIAALDDCTKEVLKTLKQTGQEKNTILVFTSDHGDMLGSQGQKKKQRPWDESIKVPFLLRYPALAGTEGRRIDMPINAPDIMPTLLGLSSIKTPTTVEGDDFSDIIRGVRSEFDNAALITCPAPFGQWQRRKHGGKEYRGIRTQRYTYVRDLKGPWLLYDNKEDPYQLKNLCNSSENAELQKELDNILNQKLEQTSDEFLTAEEYVRKWSYKVNKSGTVGYTN